MGADAEIKTRKKLPLLSTGDLKIVNGTEPDWMLFALLFGVEGQRIKLLTMRSVEAFELSEFKST